MLSGIDQPREPATSAPGDRDRGVVRALGLGRTAGACDDDPAAIGTYGSAGARFGPAFLWIAPIARPMMDAVACLSSKRGQARGRGLCRVIKDSSSRRRSALVQSGQRRFA